MDRLSLGLLFQMSNFETLYIWQHWQFEIGYLIKSCSLAISLCYNHNESPICWLGETMRDLHNPSFMSIFYHELPLKDSLNGWNSHFKVTYWYKMVVLHYPEKLWNPRKLKINHFSPYFVFSGQNTYKVNTPPEGWFLINFTSIIWFFLAFEKVSWDQNTSIMHRKPIKNTEKFHFSPSIEK